MNIVNFKNTLIVESKDDTTINVFALSDIVNVCEEGSWEIMRSRKES